MGTGLRPSPRMVCFSAMTVESADQHKGRGCGWDAASAAASNTVVGRLSHVALHGHRQHRHTGARMGGHARCRLLGTHRVGIFIVGASEKFSFSVTGRFYFGSNFPPLTTATPARAPDHHRTAGHTIIKRAPNAVKKLI